MCTIEPACLPDVSQMYVIRYARRAELPAEEMERERGGEGDNGDDGE